MRRSAKRRASRLDSKNGTKISVESRTTVETQSKTIQQYRPASWRMLRLWALEAATHNKFVLCSKGLLDRSSTDAKKNGRTGNGRKGKIDAQASKNADDATA